MNRPNSSAMMPVTMTSSIQKLKNGFPLQENEEPILLTPEPVQIPDKHVAESLFTKSMTAMTPSDREDAYDDVHAIPVELEEDFEIIQESLERLEFEIEMREDIQAYLLAKQLNPDYVYNQDFRLSFLRADRFDAKKAAFRMGRHFQIKMELFGKEKLGMDIVQDDLDENDMEVLYEGTAQLLPTKDRGGRAIMLFGNSNISRSQRARRLFYLLMLAVKDTKSFVAIICMRYNQVSEKGRENSVVSVALDGAWMAPRLLLGMPIHLAAAHLGYDSETWAPMDSMLKCSLGDDYRVRIRTFKGSTKEWLDSLKRYGVHPDQVPIRDHGNFESSEYQKMLRDHRAKERRSYPHMRNHIKSPGQFDILFGKGSRYQEHEGNVRLRRLIADCKKTYDKTERGVKFFLVQELVDTVKQSAGLFLKEDGEGRWIVVDDEAAAKKVGALFRSLRAQDARA